MGIRVNKVLGWGLTDLKVTKKNKIVDPRLTPAAQENLYDVVDGAYQTFPDWISTPENQTTAKVWCSEMHPSLERRNPEDFNSEIYLIRTRLKDIKNGGRAYRNPFHHMDEEGLGLSRVIVFREPFSDETHRYDDLMDYYEAKGKIKPIVKDLSSSCGIYPYLGVYAKDPMVVVKFFKDHPEYNMRFRTFSEDFLSFVPSEYNQLVGRWDKGKKPLADDVLLDFLLKNYRPAISPTVCVFVRYANIFVDFNRSIQDFKPLLYTYWS